MYKKIIAVILIIAACFGTFGMKSAIAAAPQEGGGAAMDCGTKAAFSEYETMKEFQIEIQKLQELCQNVIITVGEPDLSALTVKPEQALFCRDIFVLVFADEEKARTAAEQVPGAIINAKQTLNNIFCDGGSADLENSAAEYNSASEPVSSLKLAMISNAANALVLEKAVRSSVGNGTEIECFTIDVYRENGESTMLDLCIAIETAVEESADLILLTSGGQGSSVLLEKAVLDAYNAGIPVVTAAGDKSEEIREHVPANVKRAITVSAVDEKKRLAQYSNYGSGTDFTSYGSYCRKPVETDDEKKSVRYSGTSIAAAYVCAYIASAMLSDPGMDPDRLEDKMIAEAQELEDDIITRDNTGEVSLRYGHGFLYPKAETDQTGNPEESEIPEEPDALEELEILEEPSALEEPEHPEEPDALEEPEHPEEPGKAEKSAKSGKSEKMERSSRVKAAGQEKAASVHVNTFSEFKKYAESISKDYVIYLDRTINLTEQMDIAKKITIYLNGYTIRPKDKNFPVTNSGVVRVAFNVKKNAVLTFKGSGNISGNSSALSMQGNLINVKSGGKFEADNVTFLNVKNVQSVMGDGATSLLFNDGTAVLNHCTVKNCVSDYGYTLFNRAGTMDISKCTIQGNTGGAAAGNGGKIFVHNNTLIQGNTMAAKYKEKNYKGASNGGLVAQKGCTMYLYGTVTVSKNASVVSGGGMHVMGTVLAGYKPDGSAVVSKLVFQENKSERYGGGIGVYGGKMSLSKQVNLEVKENQCASGYTGSGIYVSSGNETGKLTADVGAALSVHGNGTVGSGICVGKGSELTLATNNVKVYGEAANGIISSGNVSLNGGSFYQNKSSGIYNSGNLTVNGGTFYDNGSCGLWNSTNGILKVNGSMSSGFRKYKSVSDYETAANGTYAVKNEGIMDIAGKSGSINGTRLYGNHKNYAVFGNMKTSRLTVDENTNLAIFANGSKWGFYNDAPAAVSKINGNKTAAGSNIEISGTAAVGMENFGTADLHNISINGKYRMGSAKRTVSDKKEIGILLRQSGGKMVVDGEKTTLSNAGESGIYVMKNSSISLLGGTISANKYGIYNGGTVTIPSGSMVNVSENITGIYNSRNGTLLQKDGTITKSASKTGIEQHGIYKMSGNAAVDESNYVYLAAGCCITVDAALNTKRLTARIRPEDYFLGRVVVRTEAVKGKEQKASDVQNWGTDRDSHVRFTLYTSGKDEEFTQKVYSELGLGDKINKTVFSSGAGLEKTKTFRSSKNGASLYDKILSQEFAGKKELTAAAESWKNDIFLTETYSITFDDHIYISYDSSRDSEKEEYRVKAWKRYTDSEVNNTESKASLSEIMKNADLFRVHVNNRNPQIKYWCEDLPLNIGTDAGGTLKEGVLKDATLKTTLEEADGKFAYWFLDKKEYPSETDRQSEYSDGMPNLITQDDIVKADHVYTWNEAHVLRSAWDLTCDVDYSYHGTDAEKKERYRVNMAQDPYQPLLSDYTFLEYVEMEHCSIPDAQNQISDGGIIYEDAAGRRHEVTDYVSSVAGDHSYSALQKAEEASADDTVRHIFDENNETVRKYHLSEQPVTLDRNMETGQESVSVFLAWTQDPYAEFDYKNMFGRDSLKPDFLFPMYLQKGIGNPGALMHQQKVYDGLWPPA